jgi:hypothetical protein
MAGTSGAARATDAKYGPHTPLFEWGLARRPTLAQTLPELESNPYTVESGEPLRGARYR